MSKIKHFLYKNLGITLDRRFFITVGIFLASCILATIFAILDQTFHYQIFKDLMLITAIPAGFMIMVSCFNTLNWDFATKEEKREIEQKIALKQLQRRINDKDYER